MGLTPILGIVIASLLVVLCWVIQDSMNLYRI